MAKKKAALGDCFRWAYQYVLKHPNALLHQGLVTAPYGDAGPKPFEHGWITEGGLVKDWQTMVAGLGGRYSGVGWPESTWKQMWHPQKVKVYSIEQAAIEMAKHEHYGPWR